MKALFGWLILAIVAIFSVATARATSIPLYSFSGSDGQFPYAGLVQGSDGNFYGTTSGYNYEVVTSSTYGTVFKMTPGGSLTTLHTFGGTDGGTPQAALVQGSDGNFYGTTNQGGANGLGTVFRITPGGSLTTLHSFNLIDGAYPMAALVQGSDGNFYGTTREGGANSSTYYPNGFGTVFKITSGGSLTTLHSFGDGSDGRLLYAGLVQGSDGNFYGTTQSGGTGGAGTVFKITPAGSLTPLYSFNDGYDLEAGLVQGSDGNFYGTTNAGGFNDAGTAFKITSDGSLTTLHNFGNGGDGAYPAAGLIQGSDGNFYGTTRVGTVFKMTPDGSLTTLYAGFSGSDGYQPYGGLVQGKGGNLYGTTYYGGASFVGFTGTGEVIGYGTVFKLTVMFMPTNADQCKDGGWATFTTPFKSQGDCIQFVNTGK